MRAAARVAIVAVLLLCAAGLWWMVRGPEASGRAVGNANVVGGVAGVLAVAAAVVVLWPRGQRSVATISAGQVEAAVEYLARETLRSWREQAKDRRITTPSPAAVRWRWSGPDVAVPAAELLADLADRAGSGSADGSAGGGVDRGSLTKLRTHSMR